MSSHKKEEVIYGDLYLRMFAWFIDISLILIVGWFLSEMIIGSFGITDFGIIWLVKNLTDFILGFLYFWLMETITGGKTLGKYVVNIKTVGEKELEPVTPYRYAVNNLTKSTILLILDIIFGFFLRKGKEKGQIRHTQLLSRTVVIKESQ
ncbi:MAG: RDD family protein [Promethearchaeia archaeon]